MILYNCMKCNRRLSYIYIHVYPIKGANSYKVVNIPSTGLCVAFYSKVKREITIT